MDKLDIQIKKILKEEVYKPIQYEHAIQNAFNTKSNKHKNNSLYKIIFSTSCLIILFTGIIGAGYIVKEKIWKDPVIINQKEIEKGVLEEISEEEKLELISENKAINIGNQIIETFNQNEEIKKVNLIRGYDSNVYYVLKTETESSKGIIISLNSKTGELDYYCNNSVMNKNIKSDEINEEKVKIIAKDIYTKLNLIHADDGYEIMNIEKTNMLSDSKIKDMWQVTFAKKYNDIFNKETSFSTSFLVKNGKPIIYIIKGKPKENFENNPIIISKEEAIKIAENKEKSFSNLEISNTNAELSIEKMNTFIFCLEKNITNENGEYMVNDEERSVWKVEVKHNREHNPRDSMIETVRQQYDKKYYIDATTGEIIGGEAILDFN